MNHNDAAKALTHCSDILKQSGVNVKPFRSTSNLKSKILSNDDFKSEVEAIEIYNDIMSFETEITEPQGPEYDIAKLEEFLNRYGLYLKNPYFMKNFNHGDLVEVYSLNHKQIFRNPNFFKVSSYDLDTLVFVPWEKLFIRHFQIQNDIIDLIQNVIKHEIGVLTSPNIPKHFLTECYEEHNRSIKYSMKQIGTVLDKITKKPMGYITILDASALDEDEGKNIYHLFN